MERMILAAFLYPTGYHVAGWRHADTPADAGINFPHYAELARLAEAGRFDFLFLPDSLAVRGSDLDALSRTAIRYVAQFEPITLLSALAAVTKHIGLAATATTTYHEPYHVARMFASLDHISAGRVGWNLVTSQNTAESGNFGLDAHPAHDRRYERAREFVDVVRGLWDSWDDEAFVRDKEAGRFFDPEGLRVLDHRGTHFSVSGPLNVPRPPQGHPVVIQAGSSEAGLELAAATADVVFTAQHDLSVAKRFYADLKGRLSRFGRSSSEVKVLVGVFPYCGPTDKDALALRESLQSRIHPIVGLSLLEGLLDDIDLTKYPLDGPLPPVPETNASQSRRHLLVELARREQLSIRELYLRVAGGRGHLELVGSYEYIADELERWHCEGAADGFIIMPPMLPGGLVAFVEGVIPILRNRGLFPMDYQTRTLREHLGLRRPARR